MGMFTGYRILATLTPDLGKALGDTLSLIDTRKDDDHSEEVNRMLSEETGHPLYRLINLRHTGSAYFQFAYDNHGNPVNGEMCNADEPLLEKDGSWVIDLYFSTSRFPWKDRESAAKMLAAHLVLEPEIEVPFLMSQYEEDRNLSPYGAAFGTDNKTTVYFAKLTSDGRTLVQSKFLDMDIREESFPDIKTAKIIPDRF